MIYKPEVLIISNLHDYSTDHVIYQLQKHDINYLRLNRDQFNEYKLSINPITNQIFGKTMKFDFEISEENLKSIYFRAPIYLRSHQRKNLTLEENISRDQWSSFLRSLMIFENVIWINHPKSTFLSENKPYQLKVANKIGFEIPNTIITNEIPEKISDLIAVKTLEPVIFDVGDKESFVYTNIRKFEELYDYDLSTAPIIIQEAIIPKIDVRVTVIGNNVYSVTIKKNNFGVDGDWRTIKNDLTYELIQLPNSIKEKCVKLIKKLNLYFGCIDLVLKDNRYYFIEINPTGEWDWLMYNLDLDIDVKIADYLIDQ